MDHCLGGIAIKQLEENYDYIAPDGSEIRLLAATTRGGLAQVTVPPNLTSRAVKYQFVEEIWYATEGQGRF